MGALDFFRQAAAAVMPSRAVAAVTRASRALRGVSGSRAFWWPMSVERNPGDFQRDVHVDVDSVLAQSTVFACATLIKSDIGKLRPKLVERDSWIWTETESPAFSPVLRRPNAFQTWQKFIEQWVLSLLFWGNAYILKERDSRGIVIKMYVLDPHCVRVLLAESGDVYYELVADDLAHIAEQVSVPASEIIHDRLHCLFHPLVGMSPIFACGLAAMQALKIQQGSAKFFGNMSRPGGVLTAPAKISDETAQRLRAYFEQNFTGTNSGKVAVLGDGLKYEAMGVNPVDAQLVEQLKLSAEQICATFHVPAYMVNAGPVPAGTSVEALHIQYYSQCLQSIIESIENNLDEGLGLGRMADGRVYGIELDLDGLLRMDSASLFRALGDAIKGGWMAPNEARRRANLPPVVGGNTPYIQQQNFGLAALAKRDADDPFSKPTAPTAAADDEGPEPGSEGVAIDDASTGQQRELRGSVRLLFAQQMAELQLASERAGRAEAQQREAQQRAATLEREAVDAKAFAAELEVMLLTVEEIEAETQHA